MAVYFYDLEAVPSRASFRVETQVGDFVTLKQPFEAGRVEWLAPEIRLRHELPDLRARVTTRAPD